MSSLTFEIPGTPVVSVEIEERDGDLVFTLDQNDPGGNTVADLRGLFFDVADPSVLASLSVDPAPGSGDITQAEFDDDAVINLGGGANMNGEGGGPYDVGIEIGNQGLRGGGDDVRATTFTLSSSDGDLSLDLLEGEAIGVRLMSVGPEDGGREGSEKNTTTVPSDDDDDDAADDDDDDDSDDDDDDGDDDDDDDDDADDDDDDDDDDADDADDDDDDDADDDDDDDEEEDPPADGNDTIQGLDGDDRIYGNGDRGSVTLTSGASPEIVVGDNLFGNSGADTFVYQAGDGVDLVWDFKQSENDQIVFQGLTREQIEVRPFDLDDGFTRNGLFVDLDGDGVHDDGAIVFKDPARIDDGFFAAHVTFEADIDAPPAGPRGQAGTDGDNFFAGVNGDDDQFAGGAGNDRIFGNGGANVLDGGPGDDRVDGGARGDVLIGGAGDDLMEAQAGDDVIWGDGGGGTDGGDSGSDGESDAGDDAADDDADSGDGASDDSGLQPEVLQAFPGGYIASVEIDPGEVNGGEGFTAFAATIDAGDGGRVVNGWSSDLNAPLTFATSGEAGTFSNADVWRRALDADDSFTLTYQVQGGTPDDDTISFEVIDRQAADSAGVAANVQVTDHGGTVVVNVTVTNQGATAIDDWTLELAFNGALSVDHVWGASDSSPDPQTVILDAVAENGALAAGATLEAGFVASDAGGGATQIQLLDQDFI